MAFPQYKEWMGVNDRISNACVEGVMEFIKYAQRSLKSDDFPCPCNRCDNGRCLNFEEVEFHLVKWGIVEHYQVWIFHGERDIPFVPEQQPETSNVQVEHDHSSHPRLNKLINDSLGVHKLQENQSMDCDGGEVSLDKEYMRLKDEADKPLYPNCKEGRTSLYAMVGLQNLKSRFCLSGNSVTGILSWVKDWLPKENTLPDTYPSMKTKLRGLGMKYKSIHACKYDCILYRKEHENKENCPVCNEPRFTLRKDRTSKKLKLSRVPQKVLKYFPLGPRLKRLYTVPWISEAMTWHARAEEGRDLMRHPIDSTIWKAANITHPEFDKEKRNVRLGLATDGFNPFGNLASN